MQQFYGSVLFYEVRHLPLAEMKVGIKTFKVNFFRKLGYVRKNGFDTNN